MSAPAGWMLVPIEASREMLESMDKGDARQTWRNMLAAAPEPPADVGLASLAIEAADVLEAVGVSGVALPPCWRWHLADELRGAVALAPPEVTNG